MLDNLSTLAVFALAGHGLSRLEDHLDGKYDIWKKAQQNLSLMFSTTEGPTEQARSVLQRSFAPGFADAFVNDPSYVLKVGDVAAEVIMRDYRADACETDEDHCLGRQVLASTRAKNFPLWARVVTLTF